MDDQPTELFLRHLQKLTPGSQLALRLPGEKHLLLFPEESWHFAGLDEVLDSEEAVVLGDFGRLDVVAWNSSPYTGRLLCLSPSGSPPKLDLKPLNATLRMFWEREEARATQSWRVDLLHKLLDHSLELITLMATDGRLFYQTSSFERLLQLKRPNGNGLNYLDWVHPDDLPLVRNCLLRIGAGEPAIGPVEYRLAGPPNEADSIHFVESWFTSVEAETEMVSVVVHSRDITGRKAAAKALISRERRYRQVLDELHQAVFELDSQGNLAFVNSSWEKITGFSPQDSLGKPLGNFFHLENDYTLPLHREVYCRSGPHGPWWVELWLHSQRSGRGGQLGLALDITQRKLMQRQLDKMAQLVDQAIEIVALLDSYGRVTYVNPAYSLKTSQPAEALIWSPFFNNFACLNEVQAEDVFAEVQRTGIWSGRLRCFHLDGSDLVMEAVFSKVHDERGEFREFLVTCRDVTREVQLEEQLRASQRLESLGMLAGGVAHDFNNLVQVIMGNCSLEQASRENEGRDASPFLSDVMAATERAQRLTRQLLTFASRQPVEKVAVDLQQLVPETMRVIHRWFPDHIQYEFISSVEEAWVECDSGQLEQVVLNLAVNARDAMPKGGRLTVSLEECQDIVEGYKLSFRDTGIGMSTAEKSRIFEPFFSTKGKEGGTGLGLSVVYGVVRSHEGRILVQSSPGEGTCFEVYLPRTQAAGERRMTILVVEDEPLVLSLHTKILENHGYRVLGAVNGEEALEVFVAQPDDIDAVIMDIGLPDMNGIEAFRRIQETRAEIPGLFCSGLGQFRGQGAGGKSTDFLEKPVDGKLLVSKLVKLLGKAS
ncbi:PAS domain S-box protein [bacterium]|nr:PAS domain S-box protein [bacterium]